MDKKFAEFNALVDGLDTFINPTEIDDGATPDCQNVIPTGKGAFKTRLGRTKHGGEITSTYSGQGYFTYINSSGTYEELVIVNGVLKKKNGTSWDTISGGTFSASARVCAVQMADRLYFADGVTALCYYDGTNIVTTGVADAPLPSILIRFKNRLYANDVDNPDRFYFGGALTSAGGADNTGNFGSGSPSYGGYYGYGLGKIVNGFGKLGANYLVVGLKEETHRISVVSNTGESDALDHLDEMISNAVGCSNHFAIDNMENDLIIPSWSDIFLVGEIASYSSWRARSISNKVSSIISGISASMIGKTAGIYSPTEKKYYFAYADGTTYNNKVLVYDSYYKSWWKFSNWNPAAWVEFNDGSNNYYLNYISDNHSDSFCYQVNSGANDDNTAINWYWKSKIFDLKGFDIPKKFKRWASLFGPTFGTITITIYIDDQVNTASLTVGTPITASVGLGCKLLGSFLLGAESNASGATTSITNDYRWRKIKRPNEGTRVQFMFSGNAVNEAGQIEKFKFYYNENKRKKDRNKRIA